MLLVILVRPKIYVLQKYDFLIIYIFSIFSKTKKKINVSHMGKKKKELCLTLFTYSHKEIKELSCKKLKRSFGFKHEKNIFFFLKTFFFPLSHDSWRENRVSTLMV